MPFLSGMDGRTLGSTEKVVMSCLVDSILLLGYHVSRETIIRPLTSSHGFCSKPFPLPDDKLLTRAPECLASAWCACWLWLQLLSRASLRTATIPTAEPAVRRSGRGEEGSRSRTPPRLRVACVCLVTVALSIPRSRRRVVYYARTTYYFLVA